VDEWPPQNRNYDYPTCNERLSPSSLRKIGAVIRPSLPRLSRVPPRVGKTWQAMTSQSSWEAIAILIYIPAIFDQNVLDFQWKAFCGIPGKDYGRVTEVSFPGNFLIISCISPLPQFSEFRLNGKHPGVLSGLFPHRKFLVEYFRKFQNFVHEFQFLFALSFLEFWVEWFLFHKFDSSHSFLRRFSYHFCCFWLNW